jgi:hypothetical protein
VQIDTAKWPQGWKTTASGLMSLAIASLFAVHFDASGHFAMTPKDWFILALGFGKAAVGFVMQDAAMTPDAADVSGQK